MNYSDAQAAEINEGLRKYMLGVYNHMATGLAIAGLTAWVTANVPAATAIFYGGPQAFVFLFAPLGLLLVMSFGAQRMSGSTLTILYYVFTLLMGISLARVFFMYTDESIARTFFITAASFAALSLYGYTTKRSLSALGAACMMGVVGLVLAMVVNMFVESSMMSFVIAVIGVLVFAGLTAYDTQAIKQSYYEGMSEESAMKNSIFGATHLFINFINLFQFLLMFLGNRE